MFHSFSTSDGSLHHPAFFSTSLTAAPHDLHSNRTNTNGCFPLLPTSPPPASSLPYEYHLHKSSSVHSLALHHRIPEHINVLQPPPYSSSPPSSCDYLDFSAGPVRRVVSTGDLQVTKVSNFVPAACSKIASRSFLTLKIESLCSFDEQGMNGLQETHRVGRYSAEERKERIERYRSKRNQRNFQKKITYACRKTLADSRPRVRGRFARNGEMEMETEVEPPPLTYSLDCFSYDNHQQSQSFGGDWRGQLQAALAVEDEPESCYDEELLASFADVFSMNILS
ncbi:zinc finger protein CONSTANS-LIKE 2-like [Canna indica]|uniref:Zinc finger protein CONSTANS-LIKE 2-like n=1 Tax=Canna indica TaxID=4628 RepID=A0AAQ3QJY6_9LILI|nr:zinc finger protein CONSTANS-LIKE 2-like [Canna indica]